MKAVNVDDVLKILHKYGRYIFVTDEKTYSSMVDEIANLKALKQEPQKMGQWIMTGDYLTAAYGSVDYVKCSCCGEDSLEEGDFCPNCGARMEGGAND